MAEPIHRHMESQIPELRALLEIKLFDETQIKEIVRKRKDHEYKTNNCHAVNSENFISYLNYEASLLQLIKRRRDETGISEKKNAIEHVIVSKMNSLFAVALKKFSNDFALRLKYFKFCRDLRMQSQGTSAINGLMTSFSQKEEVWTLAAEWYKKNDDMPAALSALNKGVSYSFHKQSAKLYRSIFLFEIENFLNNRSNSSEELINNKLKTCLRICAENITDYSFYESLLDDLDKHRFTKTVQEELVNLLLEKYHSEPKMWHKLAQRELENRHPTKKDNEATKTELCLMRYEEGLQKIQDLKSKSILNSYLIDFLINIHQENKGENLDTLSTLLEAFETAKEGQFLEESYYIKWIEFVDDAKKVAEILYEATTSYYPNSIELWKVRLQFSTIEEPEKVDTIFKSGVKLLDGKSLPLWQIIIRYYHLKDVKKLQDIYEKGIERKDAISFVLKPKYVEWLYLSEGINMARKKYNLLAGTEPFSKELHAVMSKLESLEMKPDLECWEEVHKLACKQFGKDVDVQIDYLNFVLRNKNNNVNTVNTQELEELKRNALKELDPVDHERFMAALE